MSTLDTEMLDIGRRARVAANTLRLASGEARTAALEAMAQRLETHAAHIANVNESDISAAQDKQLTDAERDRLRLDVDRARSVAGAVTLIAQQPDPVGAVMAEWTRPNGLRIQRVRTPIGVIGMIFESRPNVAADAGALAVRSGNAVILRGGSESGGTVATIVAELRAALAGSGLPEDIIQVVPTQDRAAVGMMLAGLGGAIDVVVPRGGKSLVRRVQDEARVPVFAHLEGICHTYVHTAADPQKAQAIVLNAKMRRVSICGATETLLIDRAVTASLLPPLAAALREAGCLLRGDDEARAIAPMEAATEDDWRAEYLAPILAVRVVSGIDNAISHIARYGSQHTESIITEDTAAAARLLREVDSEIVLHNAWTLFAVGGDFGFGGEIGIATGRIHARGPVGAEQLTTFKFVVHGDGQIRP
jgi:glutamate-5-semialdehyde dehydrogenase